MNLVIFFLAAVACFGATSKAKKLISKKLPSYITPCSGRSDDLSACAIKYANEAIPRIVKGDPEYRLPTFLPFHLQEVSLKPSDQLSLLLYNLDLYGLESMKVKKANMDLKRRYIEFTLFGPALKIDGSYNISGRILVLPIYGDGKAVFKFNNGEYVYAFNYDLVKKQDGKEYMDNIKSKVSFSVPDAHYHLDNLFNGNKELGENMNQVLNENSQEVLQDFGLAIRETIKAVATKMIETFLSIVPYDEVFPL